MWEEMTMAASTTPTPLGAEDMYWIREQHEEMTKFLGELRDDTENAPIRSSIVAQHSRFLSTALLKPFDGQWKYACVWLENLETYFELVQMPENSPDRVFIACLHLLKAARRWYSALAYDSNRVRRNLSWADFRAAFLQRAKLGQPSDAELVKRVLSFKQQGGVYQYAMEFRRQISFISSLTSGEADLMFFSGLAPHLQCIEEVRESLTWEEALRAARLHERERKERRPRERPRAAKSGGVHVDPDRRQEERCAGSGAAEDDAAALAGSADDGSPRCHRGHGPHLEVRDCPERTAKKPQRKPVQKGKRQACRGATTGADGAGGHDIEKLDGAFNGGPDKHQGTREGGGDDSPDRQAPLQAPRDGRAAARSAVAPAHQESRASSPRLSVGGADFYSRQATINGQGVMCILSTAASDCCMDLSIARQLGLQLTPAKPNVTLAFVARIKGKFYWAADVLVDLGESAWAMDFLVGDMPEPEILLGAPYVHAARPVLDFDAHTWAESADPGASTQSRRASALPAQRAARANGREGAGLRR